MQYASRLSIFAMETDVKNFVVASTANYYNSGIYPISGSQVGLTNVLSCELIICSFCLVTHVGFLL